MSGRSVQIHDPNTSAIAWIDDTLKALQVTGAIRQDSDGATTADGEAAVLQVDSDGFLKVNIKAGAGSGGTAMTDDAAFTPGATAVTPAAGTYRTSRDLLDDGDAGAIALNEGRGVYVTLETPDLDSAMDDTNDAVRVNVVAGSSGGPSAVDDSAFTVGTDSVAPMGALADETTPDSVDEGDVGIPRMTLDRKLLVRVVGGTDSNRMDVDGSGHAQVDIAAASVTVPISAVSLPLPTGAATEATLASILSGQLPDGHDVTVDNAAGAAAVNIQDGGNSLTVDNAALSVVGGGAEATALRVTIADDSTGVISVDDNGGSLTIDAASLPLPTGAATEATLAAILSGQLPDGHNVTVDNGAGGAAVNVQDGGNSLTVDGTVTADAGTGPWPVTDNGGSLTIDAVSLPLPTGAATEATLSTIASTLYAEDSVHVSGDLVRMAGVVRNDGDTTLAGTSGDRAVMQVDASGRLKVNTVNIGHGASAVFKECAAIGAQYDDIAPTLPVENTVSPLRMTVQRGLHVNLRNVSGTEIGTAAAPVRIDPTGTTAQPVTDDGGSLTVDAVSLPLPTGAATAANQTSVIGTDGAAGPASALSVGGTESGGTFQEVRVDSDGHLQVDVLSGGGGGTQYTEDDASAANPVGNQLMARRRDAPASETGTDGDVTALNCTEDGSLRGDVTSITERTASGTIAATGTVVSLNVEGYAGVAIQLFGTWAGTVLWQVTVDGTNWHSVKGRMYDASSTARFNVGTTINCIALIPTAGVLAVRAECIGYSSGTIEAEIRATLSANSDPGVYIVNDAGDGIGISATQPMFVIQSDGSTAVDVRAGDVAHDAVDSGNPLKIGFQAAEFAATPPEVSADADRVNAIATPQGQQWVLGGHPNIVTREFMSDDGETDTDMLGAVAAGSHVVVLGLQVLADAANTATPQVRIGFGAASVPSEPATGAGVDGVVLTHPGLAAGSGVILGNAGQPIAVGGDGEELRVTCGAPTGGQLSFIVTYYVATL